MDTNLELVEIIKNKAKFYLDADIRNSDILETMKKVDRANFLPDEFKKFAYSDNPIPIGFNQTCSQPSMVAFMLDKLEIKNGNKILEIGSGCGYAAAISSILCGSKGIVYASEIIPELVDSLESNLKNYIKNIVIISKDGSKGFTEYSPFDRIFLSAGVNSNSFNEKILLDQLTDDGILIYPETIGSMFKLKKYNKKIIKENYHGVSFVPLKGINA